MSVLQVFFGHMPRGGKIAHDDCHVVRHGFPVFGDSSFGAQGGLAASVDLWEQSERLYHLLPRDASNLSTSAMTGHGHLQRGQDSVTLHDD